MELLSAEFFSALLAIIIIDLVLAGDNAIVIALAARNLPREHRNKAIVWGTFGAIAVRTVLTLVVVWLLKIPGLLLLGGVLLIWIAYKLLADNNEAEHQVSAASSFWDAMKTIVVADAVMGLDNVLAVAGAAHGNFLLVVIGLLISIPIVIWGSQLILKYVERFPAIIYIGGAVLAWTAAKMLVSEPLIKEYLQGESLLSGLIYAAVMLGVLGGGFWSNRSRARTGIGFQADGMEKRSDAGCSVGNPVTQGDAVMKKILLPVDGSQNALQAVRHVANYYRDDPAPEVHLLFVCAPVFRLVPRYSGQRDREKFRKAEIERALAPSRELLNQFGIPHAEHVEAGGKIATIDRMARRLGISRIVMGVARRKSLTGLFDGMFARRLMKSVKVPVEIVPGNSVSKLERIGVPAGIGAGVTTLLIAVD